MENAKLNNNFVDRLISSGGISKENREKFRGKKKERYRKSYKK